MSDQDLIQKPKSKATLLKILLIVLIIVLVLILLIFGLYKTLVDCGNIYNEKYDDVPTLIQDYEKDGDDLSHIVEYSKETKTCTFTFSKGFIYSNFDYQNKIKYFKDKYKLDIQRFGFELDTIGHYIYIYAEGIYDDSIESCLKADISYIIENESIKLILKDYTIGKELPKEWFKDLLPYKIDDVIYIFKIEDIEGLKETGFSLQFLDNIEYVDNKYIKVTTDVENLALELIETNISKLGIDTNDPNYKDTIGKIIPEVVDSILGSLESKDIVSIIDSFLNK